MVSSESIKNVERSAVVEKTTAICERLLLIASDWKNRTDLTSDDCAEMIEQYVEGLSNT